MGNTQDGFTGVNININIVPHTKKWRKLGWGKVANLNQSNTLCSCSYCSCSYCSCNYCNHCSYCCCTYCSYCCYNYCSCSCNYCNDCSYCTYLVFALHLWEPWWPSHPHSVPQSPQSSPQIDSTFRLYHLVPTPVLSWYFSAAPGGNIPAAISPFFLRPVCLCPFGAWRLPFLWWPVPGPWRAVLRGQRILIHLVAQWHQRWWSL